MTVGEIVTLLRVTAQTIQGPLRTLIDHGLIRQEASEEDRRKRYLFITPEGEELFAEVSRAQFRRISAALEEADSRKSDEFLAVMRAMMDDADRDWLYPPERAARRAPRLSAAS